MDQLVSAEPDGPRGEVETVQARVDAEDLPDRICVGIFHAQEVKTQATGLIHVSENARKAVLIRRSRKSR